MCADDVIIENNGLREPVYRTTDERYGIVEPASFSSAAL